MMESVALGDSVMEDVADYVFIENELGDDESSTYDLCDDFKIPFTPNQSANMYELSDIITIGSAVSLLDFDMPGLSKGEEGDDNSGVTIVSEDEDEPTRERSRGETMVIIEQGVPLADGPAQIVQANSESRTKSRVGTKSLNKPYRSASTNVSRLSNKKKRRQRKQQLKKLGAVESSGSGVVTSPVVACKDQLPNSSVFQSHSQKAKNSKSRRRLSMAIAAEGLEEYHDMQSEELRRGE